MKMLKILPAAASVIALTATVAFANEERECEQDGYCRTIISISQTKTDAAARTTSRPPQDGETGNEAFQVKVVRGNRVKLVLIDAYTGRLIEKRDIA